MKTPNKRINRSARSRVRALLLEAVARARLSSTFGRSSWAFAPSGPSVSRERLRDPVPRVWGALHLGAGTAPTPCAYRPALAHDALPSCDRAVTRHIARVAQGPLLLTSRARVWPSVAASV